MSAPVLFSKEVLERLRNPWPLKYLEDCSQYLVMLPPSYEISRMVTVWKKELMEWVRRNGSLRSIPHFTLANIILPRCYEDRLLCAIIAVCARLAPQWIDVNGFGNFPNGNGRNVIFVKTPNIEFFASAQIQLRRAFRAEGLQRCADYSSHPHLTIVKDLSDISFADCWTKFGRLSYHNAFLADKLVLLRRPLGRYSKCTELKTLPLLGETGGYIVKPKPTQPRLF